MVDLDQLIKVCYRSKNKFEYPKEFLKKFKVFEFRAINV